MYENPKGLVPGPFISVSWLADLMAVVIGLVFISDALTSISKSSSASWMHFGDLGHFLMVWGWPWYPRRC